MISFIIPVYNVEKYIGRCLDSLLGQTYTEWEAVCVNDGSSDGSLAILQQYVAKDARIKVISVKNGGVSRARNIALEHTKGEYIVYLDSDDFLHPQTLEITMALALKNNTDIVSWYKAPDYRVMTAIRHKLGLETINYRPASFRYKFNVDHVKYLVTDDMISHFTELSHPKGLKWPIKHYYVWRYLLRREVVADLRFVEDRIFEDFPWVSELMLKNPTVTITNLPFYYYYPNVKSIDMSTHYALKIRDWCVGMCRVYPQFASQVSGERLKTWSRYCKWPTINGQIAGKVGKIDPDDPESAEIVSSLSALWEAGAFDDADDERDIRSRAAIAAFLKK